MAKRTPTWPIITIVIGIVLLVVALPDQLKSWAPSWLSPQYHLGLDLAGGTQLDFRISEDELRTQLAAVDADIAQSEAINATSNELAILREQRRVIEEQRTNLVEAIRTVLERRINSLGVREATITPSYVGDEKHLLVECPGVIDTQLCIDTVGKTIQLEFKEEEREATPEYESGVRTKIAAALADIRSGSGTLQTIGQDMGDELGLAYDDTSLLFQDDLPKGLESVWNQSPDRGVFEVPGSLPSMSTDAEGNPVQRDVPGVFLVQVLGPRTQTGRVLQEAAVAFAELVKAGSGLTTASQTNVALDDNVPARVATALRSMQQGQLQSVVLEDNSAQVLFLRQIAPGKEQVDVSHILVAYKGAQSAAAGVERTKAEALTRAERLKAEVDGGADFATLAKAQSDSAARQNGGSLGIVGRDQLVASVADAAFAGTTGQIVGPVESPFGYHVLRINRQKFTSTDIATYDTLTITGPDAAARAETLIADMQNGRVKRMEAAIPLRLLFFSLEPTGWKDTALDGKHFRSATAILDPGTGFPVVQIAFDDEGGKLFQELTKKNIGKQIAIFVGGEIVTAPRVEAEITGGTAQISGSTNVQEAQTLAQDLNTGAIPAPIHLVGQRTVEPTLGEEAFTTSIKAGLVGIIIVMLYLILMYRVFGIVAALALAIYAILFLALFKLPLFLVTDQYMVLTLAGAAGLILSIGMAVDTNVLVFERVKEELQKGKALTTAVETGFEKAWTSVRDSNIATLITCALLFLIGTSIVRGFAITLGIGVLISMFTGMVISRWIARFVAARVENPSPALFPGAPKSHTSI